MLSLLLPLDQGAAYSESLEFYTMESFIQYSSLLPVPGDAGELSRDRERH
jgi:hypothetical protein